ncbi:histidine phosphatase family protein [Pedobacter aquae]|uniref:Histidine phosphatase family protein n=1 Tax=Pedobacter aquae TaxID=2605747 RepID=A0A5C0VJA5_9SPHI|nr:histidine phosphatase family protein [Pedobacter aquae]QEK52596.1 histidine phosphatase family protein [Pedobacter aquae]
MKKFLLFIGWFCLIQQAFAQHNTTVYIVRHAEKQTQDKKNQDPSLNELGKQRAEDLKTYLGKEKIEHIFTTPYKRNQETAAPLAKYLDLGIEFYDAHDTAFLAKRIKQELVGKKILVVGHSNTVIKIAEALGAKLSLKELQEEDYDFIIQLKIKGDKVKSQIKHFGKLHHSSNI